MTEFHIPEYEIKILQADNGFIVTQHNWEDDHDIITNREVIEDSVDERESLERLLYKVAEKFGEPYLKYSETNLNITWDKKGDKVE